MRVYLIVLIANQLGRLIKTFTELKSKFNRLKKAFLDSFFKWFTQA